MQTAVTPRLINHDEYHKMVEVGILHEDDRVELLEGVIVHMSPIGSKHVSILNRLTKFLVKHLEEEAIVSIQNPIVLDEYSEPEPDISILKFKEDFYEKALPSANDVLLLIEVSDSTIEYDRTEKLRLYAKHGIKEVWIIDLIENVIEAYRNPNLQSYSSKHFVHTNERICPLCLPHLELSTTEIFKQTK